MTWTCRNLWNLHRRVWCFCRGFSLFLLLPRRRKKRNLFDPARGKRGRKNQPVCEKHRKKRKERHREREGEIPLSFLSFFFSRLPALSSRITSSHPILFNRILVLVAFLLCSPPRKKGEVCERKSEPPDQGIRERLNVLCGFLCLLTSHTIASDGVLCSSGAKPHTQNSSGRESLAFPSLCREREREIYISLSLSAIRGGQGKVFLSPALSKKSG